MSDAHDLIRNLNPELRPGVYVFCHTQQVPEEAVAACRETEGLTVVIPESAASMRGLESGFTCRWITLTVESELSAVGLLAAVTGALAEAGIPCNAFSGIHHDHLFVPVDKAEGAMDALRALQRSVGDTG